MLISSPCLIDTLRALLSNETEANYTTWASLELTWINSFKEFSAKSVSASERPNRRETIEKKAGQLGRCSSTCHCAVSF